MVNTYHRFRRKSAGILSRWIKYFGFKRFQKNINQCTITLHQENIRLATIYSRGAASKAHENPLFEIGSKLNSECLSNFYLKLRHRGDVKILIHLPPPNHSPAGYSIFKNLKESLEYVGIGCEFLLWGDEISTVLSKFNPSIFISSDSDSYLQRIDWDAIKRYKNENKLQVGLTASIDDYGNSPLERRLEFAKKNGVDFFYSFRSPRYIESRDGYKPFGQQGYQIHSIEFSANPLLYAPVNNVPQDLPFVFLGSSNLDKYERYSKWFGPILSESKGFINGPGWLKMSSQIPMTINKYLYARAKVGLNLHLDEQIEWPCELNERTYVLAACGVPQLIDNPLLLEDRFSRGAFYSASTPSEYRDLFHYILGHPEDAIIRSKLALEEVYDRHTSFHRIEGFIGKFNNLI